MKKEAIDSLISSSKINGKTCSICNCVELPIDINTSKIYAIKNLKSIFNLKGTDYSEVITKCNCLKNNPRVHKLCILLNILYCFDLKCAECDTDYNLVITKKSNSKKKASNVCTLIFYSFINLIIYGACAYLALYPLVINKDYKECENKKIFENMFYYFAALIFIINTFCTYATFRGILCENPKDVHDYTIDIKDINESNKNQNRNNKKHYDLLYKFYRYFYKTQIRFLIEKKHKNIYICKGYGYYNKELKDLIIQNNKDKSNIFNNGGKDILNLNKKSDKNGLNSLINNKEGYFAEKSNGNDDNNNVENFKRSSTLKVKQANKNSDKDNEKDNKETKNKTANLPQVKNNNILSNMENNNRNKNEEEKVNLEKKINLIEEDNLKIGSNQKMNEGILLSDIPLDNNEKTEKNETKPKQENEKEDEINLNINININNSKNMSLYSDKTDPQNESVSSKKKNLSKSKNDLLKVQSKDQAYINNGEESKNESHSNKSKKQFYDLKYVESTELLKNEDNNNENEEKVKSGVDIQLKSELNNIFDDNNFNFLISSPLHNNGK